MQRRLYKTSKTYLTRKDSKDFTGLILNSIQGHLTISESSGVTGEKNSM